MNSNSVSLSKKGLPKPKITQKSPTNYASRPPARAAAVSSASTSATLASPSPPSTGILLPGRVSTVRGRVSVAGVLLFGRRDEQLAGVFRVADRGLGVEAEH